MCPDKIKRLTSRDRLLVDKIIVGTSKMIYLVTNRDVKSIAKASSLLEVKSQAHTAVNNMSFNESFRPSEIRQKLPIELKNIQAADLTDILNSYKRIGKIKKADYAKNATRGHPRKTDEDKKSLSGPKSIYQPTEFDRELDRVLTNIEVIKKIFRILYHSGLILKLESYIQLWIYHVMKNYHVDTAWHICTSVFPLSRKDSRFDEEYSLVNKIDSDSELVHKANDKAKNNIGSHPIEYYTKLFKKGAYFFTYNIS